jgi:hypothetical protein
MGVIVLDYAQLTDPTPEMAAAVEVIHLSPFKRCRRLLAVAPTL